MSPSSCLWHHSTPPCWDEGDNAGAKTEFICCELPLLFAQGILLKRMQGNYSSFLHLEKWKLIHKIMWSSHCLSTLQEKSPTPWGNTNSWQAWDSLLALCHICPHDLPSHLILSCHVFWQGKKEIRGCWNHVPTLVSILLKLRATGHHSGHICPVLPWLTDTQVHSMKCKNATRVKDFLCPKPAASGSHL
jgi:hypothetical protein